MGPEQRMRAWCPPCQQPAKRIDADTLLTWSERILSAGRIEDSFR